MNTFINDRLLALGFESLNEMQQATIEAYGKGSDLMLLSPTGSGKTAAFLIPMSKELIADKKEAQTLIVVPSRELALQIDRVFKAMKTQYQSVCCYGGHDPKIERQALSNNPAVVVGTPGRLLDHIRTGALQPQTIHTLILDEFDKSLELGFTDEMSSLIQQLPSLKKRVLTSATHCEIPDYVGIAPTIKTVNFLKEESNDRLTIKQLVSPVNDKLETLYELICELGNGLTIVFCNYRESSTRIAQSLAKKGIGCVLFHGGMEQVDREKAIARYRNGSATVLVATDLAARGLDIDEVKNIIHYHLPVNQEAFIHRNGRTARMDKSGSAYMILGPNEYMPEYITENIPFQKLSDPTPAPPKPAWTTLYIAKGKKDKVSKKDIVGFLIQKGGLEMKQIGMIEPKELYSFVAVDANVAKKVVAATNGMKIKNQKVKIEIAR